jgi:hypothetical protein
MSRSFLFYTSDASTASQAGASQANSSAFDEATKDVGDRPDADPLPDRESLRVLLIGSRRGVTSTIQALHRLRFAEVREWSPLMPAPNPGEVMAILTRYLLASGNRE